MTGFCIRNTPRDSLRSATMGFRRVKAAVIVVMGYDLYILKQSRSHQHIHIRSHNEGGWGEGGGHRQKTSSVVSAGMPCIFKNIVYIHAIRQWSIKVLWAQTAQWVERHS